MPWHPTEFRRFEQAFDTSTGPALIVTDKGKAYLKALGNPEGPHVLACEWIAAHLARWFGLRTFDFAIMSVQPGDEIPLGHDRTAQPGPAFITRAERGNPWGGGAEDLQRVTNKEDITRLVLFDTWIRNRDRYCVPNRRCHVDNVFLSSEHTSGEARELVAMDHTHCLADVPELTPKISGIGFTQDATVYGAFPAFGPFWDDDVACDGLRKLGQYEKEIASSCLTSTPQEWEVSQPVRAAVADFLHARAHWLAERPIDDFRPLESNALPEGGSL